jgi:hypothetical protein
MDRRSAFQSRACKYHLPKCDLDFQLGRLNKISNYSRLILNICSVFNQIEGIASPRTTVLPPLLCASSQCRVGTRATVASLCLTQSSSRSNRLLITFARSSSSSQATRITTRRPDPTGTP